MNSDNIKALIELFGNLGASSKEMFFWYLAYQCFLPILICAMVLIIFFRVLREVQQNQIRYQALKKIQEHLNLQGDYLESSTDLRTLVKRVTELIDLTPSNDIEIRRLRELLRKIGNTARAFSTDDKLSLKQVGILTDMAIPPQ